MNINIIKRHKDIMKLVRETCGEHNLCEQLDYINMYIKTEPDNNLRYLYEKEKESIELKLQLEKALQGSDTAPQTIAMDDADYFEIEREGIIYKARCTKKNQLCYDTLIYCLATNKTFDKLTANDHKLIGIRTNSNADNVRSTLDGIKKGRLSEKEKKFFIELLIAHGHTVGVTNRFPFLKTEHASAG